ncbi:MAG: type VI secretion system tube protein Hcp [Blastocatellia bacterium]|nr:type VI secretion system tube protein Hcp [Blastocatellia bacterium]
MAAVDYYLKIDGVDGESADHKHKGSIDIESFSWGASQGGSFSSGGGGGAGKVSMQDFHFVMKVNKASPKLMLACATGQHIKKAVLIARKAGKDQQEYMKVTMSDILVSSFQTGGSEGSNTLPTDQISLNFAKIEFEYKEQKADGTLGGSIKAGYDVKANKAV